MVWSEPITFLDWHSLSGGDSRSQKIWGISTSYKYKMYTEVHKIFNSISLIKLTMLQKMW